MRSASPVAGPSSSSAAPSSSAAGPGPNTPVGKADRRGEMTTPVVVHCTNYLICNAPVYISQSNFDGGRNLQSSYDLNVAPGNAGSMNEDSSLSAAGPSNPGPKTTVGQAASRGLVNQIVVKFLILLLLPVCTLFSGVFMCASFYVSSSNILIVYSREKNNLKNIRYISLFWKKNSIAKRARKKSIEILLFLLYNFLSLSYV